MDDSLPYYMKATVHKDGQIDLYRHYDKDDNLLYVGVALSAIYRFLAHRSQSHWTQDIRKITIEKFSHIADALKAEKKAIEEEKPKWNIECKLIDLAETIDYLPSKDNMREIIEAEVITEDNMRDLVGYAVHIGESIKYAPEIISGRRRVSVAVARMFGYRVEGTAKGVRMYRRIEPLK